MKSGYRGASWKPGANPPPFFPRLITAAQWLNIMRMKKQRAKRESILYNKEDLPLYISWYRDKASVALPIAYHPEIEMHLVRGGSAVYTVHDQKHLLNPGSLLVIYPNEVHTFISEKPETVVDKVTFVFPPGLVGLPSSGRIAGYRDVRHLNLAPTEAAAIARIASDIQGELDRQPMEWAAICRLRLQELIIMLKRAAGSGVAAETAHPAVARVLEIIGSRFAESLPSSKLADATGLSESRLRHLFSEHMGIGIKQYTTQLRVLKACDILAAEPELKIESVGHSVGFRYVADFNRAFVARMRITPSEYRTARARSRSASRHQAV